MWKSLLAISLCLGGLALAQPGPPRPSGPPQPLRSKKPPGNLPGPPQSQSSSYSSFPHAVGTVSNLSSTRLNLKRQMPNGGPTATMEVVLDAKTLRAPNLKNGDQAVVVYELAQGAYRGLAVIKLPPGGDPQALIQKLPKPK